MKGQTMNRATPRSALTFFALVLLCVCSTARGEGMTLGAGSLIVGLIAQCLLVIVPLSCLLGACIYIMVSSVLRFGAAYRQSGGKGIWRTALWIWLKGALVAFILSMPVVGFVSYRIAAFRNTPITHGDLMHAGLVYTSRFAILSGIVLLVAALVTAWKSRHAAQTKSTVQQENKP
jgi:hypothetical protein